MLELRGLTKRYRNGAGLGPLDYSFHDGHTYAIVGPNGAGKSTLFNSLSGILPPDSGSISIDPQEHHLSQVPSPKDALQRIPLTMLGFLSEHSLINPNFTPRQALFFDSRMRAIPSDGETITRHLALFNCLDFADTPARALSQGMLKRADLALAFSLHHAT